MTVSKAYREGASGDPGPPEAGMKIRPGPGSWLALMIVGVCVAGWMRQEEIAVWLLSEGIVEEGATQALLSALKWMSVVGAMASLPGAWRIAPWGASIAQRFRPVRALALALMRLLGPIARPMMVACGVLSGAVSSVLAAAKLWFTAAARVVGQAIHLAWMSFAYLGQGVSVLVAYAAMGIAAVAKVVGQVLRYTWLVVALVGHEVAAGIAVVSAVVGGALRHAWLAVALVGRQVAVGIAVIAAVVEEALRHTWRAVAVVGCYVGVGIAAAAAVAGRALLNTWRVVAVVGRYAVVGIAVAALIVGQATWMTIVFVAGYVGTRVGTVAIVTGQALGYAWRAVAAISRLAFRGIAAVAVGVSHGLRYVWLAIAFASRVAGRRVAAAAIVMSQALGYVWLAVVATSRLAGRGIAAAAIVTDMALRYVWLTVAFTSRLAGRGIAAVVVLTGQALGHVLLAVAITGRLAGRGIAAVVIVIGQGLRRLWPAAAITSCLAGRGIAAVVIVIGQALRYFWTGVAFTSRLAGRGVAAVAVVISQALRYVWLAVAFTGRLAGRGIAALAIVIGGGVRRIWQGVAVTSVYVARAIGAVALVVGQAMRSVWLAVVAISRHTGRRIAAVALVVGHGLQRIWQGLSIAGLHVAHGMGAVAAIVGHLLWLLGQAVAAIGRYAAPRLTAVARVAAQAVTFSGGLLGTGILEAALIAGRALYLLLRAAEATGRFLWKGVRVMGEAVGAALVIFWAGLATAMGLLGQGAVVATMPFRWALPYLTAGVSALGGHLSRGASMAGQAVGGIIASLVQGTSLMFMGLVKSPQLAFSTARVGTAAAPDAWRVGVSMVKHRKGVSAMSESNLTRERMVSLVVTMLVFFLATAALIRGAVIIWPPPPEPPVTVVHWVTGHLYFGPDLPGMAERFNATTPTTGSGKPIKIEIYNAPSSEGARELLARITGQGSRDIALGGQRLEHPDPTIITPSGAHWLVTVNHKAKRQVVDPDNARSIARAYIGIVTWREMAECMGWPDTEIGYSDIIELRNNPDGWAGYACADGEPALVGEWGETPLLAFTDPKTSSTGRAVLIALYSMAAGKQPEDLTAEDIHNEDVVEYVKEFQSLIDHYIIGTTVLTTKIYQGPRYGHFFLMPEDNQIHLVDGDARAIIGLETITAPALERDMVTIYPKEGSMARNNCACLVDADWVTDEQAEAAEQWIDYMLEDEQQRVFMDSGFRPTAGLTLDDHASKITAKYGLDPTKPTKEMDPSRIKPDVAAAIDESWEDVKRPGIVTFVVDTSGSMLGTKLQQTKDGMERVVDGMASKNQVGFLTFSDEINSLIQVAPLKDNQFQINEAVHEMRARGETALYDAIKKGIEMTDAADSDEDAIRAVVVLTDGRANKGVISLDDLIVMEANERDIDKFSGMEDGRPPRDERGITVKKEAVIGTALAMETRHDIQVFFIGIGEEADLEIGRIIAKATSAEFRGVREKDLAEVIGELEGYF